MGNIAQYGLGFLLLLIALFDCIEEPTAIALKKQLDIVRDYYNEPQ